ncbi:unnamed protein product, partial [Rotaria socialis]
MTSSDCLSSNNRDPRLSAIPRLNLPVSSCLNVQNQLHKSASLTTTPTSTSPSPNQFHTPTFVISPRFPPSNMAGFPRPPLLPLPPSAPLLLRKNIEFKPAEQEILDN